MRLLAYVLTGLCLFNFACGKERALERVKLAEKYIRPYEREAYILNDSIKVAKLRISKCIESIDDGKEVRANFKGETAHHFDSLIHVIRSGADSIEPIAEQSRLNLLFCQQTLTRLERFKLRLKAGKADPDSAYAFAESVPGKADILNEKAAKIRKAFAPLYFRRLNACPEYEFYYYYAVERYNQGYRN
ncbi:MAG: hypothetical protein V4543_10600 [Bacteroidota bacterium]